MNEFFDAKALALTPEQLEPVRLAESGIAAAKRERRKRDFIQITRDQSDRLDKATSVTACKVFRHLLFLNRFSPGKPIILGNIALKQIGISRFAKKRALDELEKLGLIKQKRKGKKSPEITVE